MKKIFYSYIIISSVIVLSLLTSALTVKYAITGEVYTDPEKAIDNSYTLFANEFDFEDQQIDQILLDDSYHSTDLLSIESDALFPGAVALYGGKENTSNSLHGFLELYSFSNIANEIVPLQMDLYTDGTIANETEYVFESLPNIVAKIEPFRQNYLLKIYRGTEYIVGRLICYDAERTLDIDATVRKVIAARDSTMKILRDNTCPTCGNTLEDNRIKEGAHKGHGQIWCPKCQKLVGMI